MLGAALTSPFGVSLQASSAKSLNRSLTCNMLDEVSFRPLQADLMSRPDLLFDLAKRMRSVTPCSLSPVCLASQNDSNANRRSSSNWQRKRRLLLLPRLRLQMTKGRSKLSRRKWEARSEQ